MKKYDVVGIGNAVVDIIFHVMTGFSKKWELKRASCSLSKKIVLNFCIIRWGQEQMLQEAGSEYGCWY